MANADTWQRLRALRLIPVLRFRSAGEAAVVADCLVEAGFGALELTLTTPGAVGLLGELRKRLGNDMLLGAGTVLEPDAGERCIAAGADFLVSPCRVEGLPELAREAGRTLLTGALTPSEVLAAWRAGADAVKLFPASIGGPAYLKTLATLFPDVPLVPTGGVDLQNVAAYFAAGAAAVGAGGNLIDADALSASDRATVISRAGAWLRAAGASTNRKDTP